MGVVEALFSLDGKGLTTEPVCKTAEAIVNDSAWPYSQIKELYDVRSRMVHGRLEADRDSDENLGLTSKMEILAKLCVLRLLEKDGLKHYKEPQTRTDFLKQFYHGHR